MPDPADTASRSVPSVNALRDLLEQRAESFAATLSKLEGEAELDDPKAPRFHPPTENMRLAGGQRLLVGQGRAALRFDDGAEVRLRSGAAVEVRPREAEEHFRLLWGSVSACSPQSAPLRFGVPSGSARADAGGTAEAWLSGNGRLEIFALREGVAVFTSSGNAVAAEGQSVSAWPGEAPSVGAGKPFGHGLGGFADAASDKGRHPSGSSSDSSARREIRPMNSQRIIAAAAVALVVVAASLSLVGQYGARSSSSGAPGLVCPTPPPPDDASRSFEETEQMFQRKRYTEARDAINKMNQSDAQVAALKLAIDSTIEANDLLLKSKIRESAYAINRIKGTYETAKPVIELRDKINWERENKARDSYTRGEMDFEAGRFDAARKFYDEADGLRPGYEGKSGPAAVLAETARLAKMATDALDRAAEYCRQQEYADAAALVDEVRNEFRGAQDLEAAEKARDYRRELNDFYAYASMQDFYQKGDATQALSYYDKLSPTFIEQYDLAKKAETMREVGRLAAKALQDRSRDLALTILEREPNYRNAYHKQMAALKAELEAEKLGRAAKLYEWGEEFADSGKHEDALKTFFEARQADPSYQPPNRRHSDMGSILMRQAHRLPLTREYAEEKRRIYELIIKNSFPEDSIHSQASNLLKEIDG